MVHPRLPILSSVHNIASIITPAKPAPGVCTAEANRLQQPAAIPALARLFFADLKYAASKQPGHIGLSLHLFRFDPFCRADS